LAEIGFMMRAIIAAFEATRKSHLGLEFLDVSLGLLESGIGLGGRLLGRLQMQGLGFRV